MEEKKPRQLGIAILVFAFPFLFLNLPAKALAYSHGPYLTLASNTFIFSPRTRTWKAVQNGKVIRSGKASGGSHYCKDIRRSCRTPSGVYRIWSKGGAGCVSSRYPLPHGGAKMPYCMFFSKYYAIHGSYEVPNYNASHGCIRVLPSDALWLSRNFIKIGTKVVVQPY
ncbi:L,D-transpeptidase [Legionella jordanis]|uniref:Enhanced entry protein EnhA n=1 Tax=Legionella jordanis TaxID=456 RepID=A0A0W0V7H7_9GAMM|nr:L,D-transpeptidase [Legionella jordanis]KTD16075.1 enhanced entry protein EnhA [Legionella jordanis]RMX04692.1 murein L,D-transpeptidase [Legionella jordanis]RMX18401.1 murein L,D-transpeptidase [Legionella jordanis]VEH12465.1 enhanced entry protein EnhA [Legionella jordanis]HAT8713976.1 L,D-transpeptidase family protein [Legionella jordanis]